MSSLALSDSDWSNKAMFPSVTKVGDTAELYCLVLDTWSSYDELFQVRWFMDEVEIDPDTDSRMEIRYVNFTTSFGTCSISDPPTDMKAPFFYRYQEKYCGISVLTIANVKEEDYDRVIKCSYPVFPSEKIGKILNPAIEHPNSNLTISFRDTTGSNSIVYGQYAAQCASTREVFWYLSIGNGTKVDVNGARDVILDWLPATFPQHVSWQKKNFYQSILIIDFLAFLSYKNVTLYCGPDIENTINAGTYFPGRFDESRVDNMMIAMRNRDAWLVVFAVPVLVLAALFIAARRGKICSGEMSCLGPLRRDFERFFNTSQRNAFNA